MITVTFMNNSNAKDYAAMPNETISHAIKECGVVDPSAGLVHINGRMLSATDLDKTFADFGFDGSVGKDAVFVTQVAKAKNA